MMEKRITFGETCKRSIPKRTREERKALWFSKEDLRSFRQQASHADNTEDAPSPNAVADLIHAEHQRRRYIIYVLQMQAEGRAAGMEDPTGLAALAIARSKTAAESAHFRATRGAAEVKAYLEASRSQEVAVATTTREEESDALKPTRGNNRRTRVSIKAPRRNRTVANMA